ncbi:MAG TPA: FhaA domain-containing protein [Pyrinomonadaceae bacterium]|nr:FhaA domain-containing protein [Pyrinomonadaceae bacterium]
MSILDKVRRWIDGESSEMVLEEAARYAQVKPRSKAEEFIVKIARKVETVMQDELVPLPQGTTIIPSEYTIFLSAEDDAEWQGQKRKGLVQGLYHILAERAKEIAGKKKLETKTFSLILRIDATLEKGELNIQHSWEDSNANKTGVLSRPKQTSEEAALRQQPVSSANKITGAETHGSGTLGSNPFQSSSALQPDNIRQAVPLSPPQDEEMTAVKSRLPQLYTLEIWRGGVRQNVLPIYRKEIVVGRGSKSKPVDIPLAGDVEISRRHLTLITDGEGNFWAINEGKNPAVINNYELPAGQRVSLTPGVPLTICSYMLRVLLR